MSQTRSLASILGILLVIGIIAGMGWGSYRFAQLDVGGEGFLLQWIGIRSLVIDGNSPYSDQTQAQIQKTITRGNSFTGWSNPQYTSPLISGVIVLPFALIDDFTLAHGLWLAVELAGVLIILLIAQRLTDWRPDWFIFLLLALIIAFSYHVVIPWMDGGLSIWVSLFMLLVLVMLRRNWDELAGFFLAMTAIQPQMTFLFILFILIWAGSHRKGMVFLWFIITLVFLSVIGLVLVPDWIMQYLRILINYQAHFPPGSLLDFFTSMIPGVGRQLAWLVTALLFIILLIEWWLAFRKDHRRLIWTSCLTIVMSQWIVIPTVPAALFSLIIPFILFAALLTERWPVGGQWVAVLTALLLFAWEWGLVYSSVINPQSTGQLSLLIPLPLVLLFGLYWVRWWGVRPKRMLMEELRLGEKN